MRAGLTLAVMMLGGCRGSASAPVQVDEPIQVGGQTLAPAEVKARLVKDLERVQAESHASCAYQVLGTAGREAYLWVLCEQRDATTHEQRSASSEPIVLKLDPSQPRIATIGEPRDGSYYADDIKRMFPPDVVATIFDDAELADRRVHALEDAIVEQDRLPSGGRAVAPIRD